MTFQKAPKDTAEAILSWQTSSKNLSLLGIKRKREREKYDVFISGSMTFIHCWWSAPLYGTIVAYSTLATTKPRSLAGV